jgi:NitT/TauT family transport system substrate-binding protein
MAGLAPIPTLLSPRKYGFPGELSVSEEETWGKLNNGQIRGPPHHQPTCWRCWAGQFNVVVPAQISFSAAPT